MALAPAVLFAIFGFIFLPAILIFIIFTPMGWSVTAFSIFVLLIYTIYKIYSM